MEFIFNSPSTFSSGNTSSLYVVYWNLSLNIYNVAYNNGDFRFF